MWVSTFHSACVRILRREAATLGLRSSFSIYDSADSQRLLTLVARELDLDPKRYPAKALASKISSLKDELVDPETFAATSGGGAANEFDTVLAQVYTRYQARLKQAHALDFDDLIMTTVHLLQAFPAVAEHYRRRFRHVLVDEYQDTNHAQYVLVRELVGSSRGIVDDSTDMELPRGELTVVGDADQSIYAFRGASIRNILEFEVDYPDARTILLEQNYRSTQNILSAANAVISRNPGREGKRLWTDSGAGAQIVAYVADTEHEEARFVAEEIDRLGDSDGVRPGDVAIFYRANAQSRALEEVLIRVGLPYKVVGGTRFYERKEIKDAVAYLRAIANPDDDVNLRRILNVPKRGLGDRSEAMVASFAERERISFGAALDRLDEVPGLGTRAITGLTRLRRHDDGPAHAVRLRRRPGRGARRGARPVRLPRGAARERGPAGRLPRGEPGRAARGGLGVRAERPRGRPGRLPGARVAGGRLRPDPRRRRWRRRRRVPPGPGRDHADDPAHRQGPRVPGRLPHRHGGRHVPAPALAVGLPAAGGGAAARVRRADPCAGAAVHLAGRGPYRLGRAERVPAQPVPGRPAGRAHRLAPPRVVHLAAARRLGLGLRLVRAVAAGTARRPPGPAPSASRKRTLPSTGATFGSATPRPDSAIPQLAVGDRVTHDSYGLGTVIALEGAGPNAVAKVDFGTDGTKRLLLRFSPVTKL